MHRPSLDDVNLCAVVAQRKPLQMMAPACQAQTLRCTVVIPVSAVGYTTDLLWYAQVGQSEHSCTP
jgi:hypothetical protein